jgi:hypothetical protein
MTTDRELLEAAAKAAGITGAWKAKDNPSIHASNGHDIIKGYFIANPRGGYGKLWNPIEDDGDALRLAVRLRLLIFIGKRAATFVVDDYTVSERHGSDPYAATRRAIVRAAAQIGGAHE